MKEELRKNWQRLWPKAMGGDGVVCPICGYGGKYKNWGTGVDHFLQDPNQYGLACMGCGFEGDAVELLQKALAKKKGEDPTEEDLIREGLVLLNRRPINAAEYLDTFWAADVSQMQASENVKTGFENLDNVTGGLYPGLYVIAALSSLGKTTFSLQLADQLAAAGRPVLFFSLEQSQLELVSKSLARIGAQAQGPKYGLDSLTIRKGFSDAGTQKALKEYREKIAERMNIIQGDFGYTAGKIRDEITRYIEETWSRPVVFVDYLQIIQGGEIRQSVREQVDSTITDLKRISREHDLTVFVISSVNRSNYLTPIDFESLKESGGIEYTADVIWGLQYACLSDDPVFEKDKSIKEKREAIREAKAADPRQIELVCLKNRYGRDFRCSFEYFPRVDLFRSAEKKKVQRTAIRI